MAAAVTLASLRLFSQLKKSYSQNLIVRGIVWHYPWCSSRSPKSLWSCVRACQHAPSSEYRRMFYKRGKRSASTVLSFLSPIYSRFSLRGREITPSARYRTHSVLSTGISFQSPQDQPGARRASAGLANHLLNVVVVNVIKDIAYKSVALRAIGHFSQEVREIKPGP